MPTSPTAHAGAAVSVDEEFLALLWEDEELLRAEFDAIVAEAWSSEPPPADRPVPSPGLGPPPRTRAAPRGSEVQHRAPQRGADGWTRERSPPLHGTGDRYDADDRNDRKRAR